MPTDDAAPHAFDDVRAAEAGAEPSVAETRFADILLAAKLESLAEFAAGAGHEINNPLAVISGRAQLLLRDERDPERRRDLAIIHMQALRVHEMIADMMLFARPPLPRPTVCDLSPLVDRVVETLRAKAATLELTVERVGLRKPVEAEVDGEQIQVALRAILDNGLNAMRPGGRVEIELRVPDDGAKREAGTHEAGTHEADTVEIWIRDDGPGIAEEHREHLFDPFYSGREAGRGLGMGLPKAWRITTNHGGTITAMPQSYRTIDGAQPTGGATFVVRLPRRQA